MQRKDNKSKNNKPQKRKNLNAEARLIPSFAGQVVKQFRMEALPSLQVTTVTTGVIANIYEIKASNVSGFTTRFASLFEEYRIVKAKVTFRGFTTVNPGLLVHWIDEKDNAAPTLAEAKVKASSAWAVSDMKPHSLTWTARDPLDLQYISTGTPSTALATYKIYTDATTFGSDTVSRTYGQLFVEFWVQFRGYM